MILDKYNLKSKNILLMYVIHVISGLMFFIPIIALYLEKDLFTITNVAIIFAVEAIAMTIFEMPTGAIADLFGRKKTLIFSSIICLLGLVFLYIHSKLLLNFSPTPIVFPLRTSWHHPYDKWNRHLQKSLLLAEEMEDKAAEMAARNNLALVYADKGEFLLGLEAARAALEISVARGDRHREAALLNNIADLLQATGQTEAAITHVKQSVAIYAEIGVDADEYQPEIWKLVEW